MQRNSRVVSFHNEEVLGSERGIVSSYNFRSCVARETRGLSGEGQTTVPASNTMIQFLSCDVLRMDPDQMTWYFSSNEAYRDLRPSCGQEDATLLTSRFATAELITNFQTTFRRSADRYRLPGLRLAHR